MAICPSQPMSRWSPDASFVAGPSQIGSVVSQIRLPAAPQRLQSHQLSSSVADSRCGSPPVAGAALIKNPQVTNRFSGNHTPVVPALASLTIRGQLLAPASPLLPALPGAPAA